MTTLTAPIQEPHVDTEDDDIVILPAKAAALETLSRVADDATWDELLDALGLRRGIDRGLQDIVDGNVCTHDEFRKRMSRWLS
jgi:hypothetical protein